MPCSQSHVVFMFKQQARLSRSRERKKSNGRKLCSCGVHSYFACFVCAVVCMLYLSLESCPCPLSLELKLSWLFLLRYSSCSFALQWFFNTRQNKIEGREKCCSLVKFHLFGYFWVDLLYHYCNKVEGVSVSGSCLICYRHLSFKKYSIWPQVWR